MSPKKKKLHKRVKTSDYHNRKLTSYLLKKGAECQITNTEEWVDQ